jgi:sugar transferase (PEP-CTERM/EpsH1 system associated)
VLTCKPSVDPPAPASKGTRSNVLYIVHRVPYPPDKGDRIRAFHILRYLSCRANVHLACLADESVPEEAMEALKQHCARVAVVPLGPRSRWLRALVSVACGKTVSEGAFHTPALQKILKQWAGETAFQASLASASSVAPYLQQGTLSEVPAVVDLVDVDSRKWLDYAEKASGLKGWIYRTEGHRLGKLEGSLAGWARALTVVSDIEAGLLPRLGRTDTVRVVTNGVDLEYYHPTPGQPSERASRGALAPPHTPPACVFVGALDYLPNVDAACWFCEEVWPGVRKRYPQAEVWLVGRRPAARVLRLAEKEGVKVVGQVPDVRPSVRQAAVSIAPLRIARGIQNKVLEAMAMGKAVVASDAALQGLPERAGAPVVCANTPQEWVEQISRLFADEELREQLGRRAREYVEHRHSWERCLEPLGQLLGLGFASEANPPDHGQE